jgi:RNA polymerase sigma factor (sigma-70 family)
VTPAGDLATFEHAYRAQGAFVADVLGRLAVPAEAVGDAVQDVFVAAYRRWDDFDPERPVRPWLAAFARRIAFRYRRSAARRHRKGASLVHLVRDRERSPGHEIEARDFLVRFLAELDVGHRDAFLMMDLEGRTAAEIADVLGISAEAVFGRVRSVRRRLRHALLQEAHEPDPRAAALVPAWAVMKARLGLLPAIVLPGIGAVSVASVKTFALTVALGLGVIGVGRVAWSRDEPSVAPRVSASPASRVAADASASTASSPDTRARVRPDDPVAASEPLVRAEESPVVVADVEPAGRSMRASGSEPPTGASSSGEGGLAEETALLQAAKVALHEGRPEAALVQLQAHAERFPAGQLADARRRTRIRALCDSGREAQARGEAHALAKARPGDPLAREALSICAAPIRNADPAEKDTVK